MTIEKYIADIENFPKLGVLFKDLSPLLANPDAFGAAIEKMAYNCSKNEFDSIGAFDARGFLFGTVLARELNKPMFMIRKPGKLGYDTVKSNYDLEYGSNTIEIKSESVKPGDRVILVDDVLATGGTMKAGADLVERLGGKVASCQLLIELESLKGKEKLNGYNVDSVLRYK